MQGMRTVAAYTKEFYRLSLRSELSIMEEQQIVMYVNRLWYIIQELHDVFSIDEAHNKVKKIERLQSRAPPSRR